MIKIIGNDIWRGGSKVGWIGSGYIKDSSGDKVGIYTHDHVIDRTGRKVAYISGDYIYISGSSRKIRIEDNEREIVGGDLSDIEKAAVRVLLGE